MIKTFGKLASILLLSAAVTGTNLSNAGEIECTEFHETNFNNEYIIFCRDNKQFTNIININKYNSIMRTSTVQNKIFVWGVGGKEGKNISYADIWGDDYKIDQIRIEENGEIKTYNNGMVIEEGQKEFDKYLKIIKESVTKKFLK